MKKIYIEPCSNVFEVEEDELMQSTSPGGGIAVASDGEADGNYQDGGDAKSRFINFADDDFDF